LAFIPDGRIAATVVLMEPSRFGMSGERINFSQLQNLIPARVITSFFESIFLGLFKSWAVDWKGK
jgi:hypothetical protein